jgi:hypothetical protein
VDPTISTSTAGTTARAAKYGGGKKTKLRFSGKKAAPFKKGGGRSKSHPNNAKGQPRKKMK